MHDSCMQNYEQCLSGIAAIYEVWTPVHSSSFIRVPSRHCSAILLHSFRKMDCVCHCVCVTIQAVETGQLGLVAVHGLLPLQGDGAGSHGRGAGWTEETPSLWIDTFPDPLVGNLSKYRVEHSMNWSVYWSPRDGDR